jgi:hypothetical protein
MGRTPTWTVPTNRGFNIHSAIWTKRGPDRYIHNNMNRELKGWLKSFLVELLVYSILVVGYFFLVLHLLADWIAQLYEGDRRLYAAVALALIVGQGIALELLTAALFAVIKPRVDEQ